MTPREREVMRTEWVGALALSLAAFTAATGSHAQPSRRATDPSPNPQTTTGIDSIGFLAAARAGSVIAYVGPAVQRKEAERARAARARTVVTTRHVVTTTRPVRTTRTTSTSTSSGGTTSSGGCAYASQINAAFGSAGPEMVHIAMRESRCQPGASNPSGAHGLFQMLGHADIFASIPGCAGKEFDAACNIAAAHALYQSSGLSPWAATR